MRSRLAGLVAGAAGAAVALVVGGCAQQYHEASWSDLVTARQQDAIERGWLPAFLPEDATDIRQRNEPSSGVRIAVATLPATVDLPECAGTSPDPVPLRADWFPSEPGDPMACADGWTAARAGDVVALWHTGTLAAVPAAPTSLAPASEDRAAPTPDSTDPDGTDATGATTDDTGPDGGATTDDAVTDGVVTDDGPTGDAPSG